VRDDLMDILTSVHLGKRLHSQTCMLHFSAKHHTQVPRTTLLGAFWDTGWEVGL